ncbi:hypothetical protein QE152_g19743 [Popillia japonica]|uniref:Uncharacterized protein n=1 Tax=Popillia japonica TaxID=7064 RepID=A0AAW1KN52_POPJA
MFPHVCLLNAAFNTFQDVRVQLEFSITYSDESDEIADDRVFEGGDGVFDEVADDRVFEGGDGVFDEDAGDGV